MTIRDLLYLDFDKAASIWSQFQEGLVERTSITDDLGKERSAGTKFGIPGVAEANLGVDYQNKRSILQTRTLHHDVLNSVERRLSGEKLVVDLSKINKDESSPTKIHEFIGDRPYLRAEGESVLEDYKHIVAISQRFNEIIEFLQKIHEENFKKSPQYVQLQEGLAKAKEAAKVGDRNQKAAQNLALREIQRQLEELPKQKLEKVEGYLLDGIRLWIDTFMPSRINFRIYPFPNCPSFQVLCNLKRECFVDSDLEHLLYGYGNRPNVALTVFGLITSIPSQTKPAFDPMKEFEIASEISESMALERGFRGAFIGLEAMEGLVRYSRYPNVTVHPIAVYRSFEPSKS